MNLQEYPAYFGGYWYDRMSADGREQQLLGSSCRDLVIKAIEASQLSGCTFGLYSEFPLAGAPFLDITAFAIPETPDCSAEFQQGDGFGYAPLVRYCCTHGRPHTCFEFDLSAGEPFNPNAVVFPGTEKLSDADYLTHAIRLLGHADRIDRVFDVLQKLPNGWRFDYFGGYNRRTDQPLRLAFKVSAKQTDLYRELPQRFLTDIASVGYSAASEDMLPALRLFLQYNPTCEVGFDLMPEGTLGPTIGVLNGFEHPSSCSFNAQALMQSRGAEYLTALQAAGYIDDRWHSAVDSVFAVRTGSLFDSALYIQRHGIHSVKLRWKNGVLLPIKMYTAYQVDPVKNES